MIRSAAVPTEPFLEASAAPDLLELNARLRAEHRRRPDPWSFPVAEVRKARDEGKGIFPPARPDPDVEEATVPADGGHPIPIRIIRPKGRAARGTYLHMHGGGWMFGNAAESDPRLRRLAEFAGLTTVSVQYRLAPEDPFPAGPDDCLAVARALIGREIAGAPSDRLAIGGESAGAHLSVVTMLRLREEDGVQPFAAANLVAGVYDLTLTPSAAMSPERLIINTRDIEGFVACAVPSGTGLREPAVSPMFAGLAGMPPARFSCGTLDLLRDDTLFMTARWAASGHPTELALTSGGCHVFEAFGTPTGEASIAAADAWITSRLDEAARSV